MTADQTRRTWRLWLAAITAAAAGVGLLIAPQLPAANTPGRPDALASAASGKSSPTGSEASRRPSAALPSPQRPARGLTKPAGPKWMPVAAGFARDFTQPETGHADWLARVSRWTSDYLTGQYANTDPHRIPSASLTRITPGAAGETVVDFAVVYDTGLRLSCRVELGPAGWKITSAQPARVPRTPG